MNIITATSWISPCTPIIRLSALALSVMVGFFVGSQLLYSQAAVPALDTMSGGRVYLIAFPDTTLQVNNTSRTRGKIGIIDDPDIFLLLIYSPVENHAIITGPAGYRREVSLRAGAFTRVHLNDSMYPAERIICDVSNEVVQDVFRIESESPVILYCHMRTEAGGDGWAPAPLQYWGKEYLVLAQQGSILCEEADVPAGGRVYEYGRRAAPSELMIIGAYDGTRVDIIRSDLPEPSRRMSIELNAGDCYQIQSSVDTTGFYVRQPELTGTRISANRPIGVLSGSSRMNEWPTRMKTGDASIYSDAMSDTVPRNTLEGYVMEWNVPLPGAMDTIFVVGHSPWQAYRITRTIRVLSEAAGTVSIRSLGKSERILPIEAGIALSIPLDSGTIAVLSTSTPALVAIEHGPSVFVRYPSEAYIYHAGAVAATSMTPSRSRWTSFAPFDVVSLHSDHPIKDSSTHYNLVVIADSVSIGYIVRENGEPIVFDTIIGGFGGTFLGQIALLQDESGYIRGEYGARFLAYILSRSTAEVGHYWNSFIFFGTAERIGQSYFYPIGQHWGIEDGISGLPSSRFQQSSFQILAVPSPARTYFLLDIAGEWRRKFGTIAMYDILGNRVLNQDLRDCTNSDDQIRVKVSDLPRGAYVVRVTLEGESRSLVITLE